MDERDPVTPGGVRLDPSCLSWRFARSSGPGGQHVNTSSSKAELRCDLAAAGLAQDVLDRLVDAFGGSVVRVVCSTERSQLRNRRLALERLAERIDAALQVAVPRRASRPSRAQRQRRLDDKHQQALRKRERRWRPGGD